MKKFEEVFERIMNGNLLCEKKYTEKDIPMLKKEEKEVRGLLDKIDKIVDSLYIAQKELGYLGRTMGTGKAIKTQSGWNWRKSLGKRDTSTTNAYDKMTDYQDNLNQYISEIQDLLLDLEP